MWTRPQFRSCPWLRTTRQPVLTSRDGSATLIAGWCCALFLVLFWAACDGVFVATAPGGSARIAVAFSTSAAAGGDGQAFDRADVARIRLQQRSDGRVVFNGDVPLTPAGGDREARIEITLDRDPEIIDVSAQLLAAGQPLFQGVTTVTVSEGQTAVAEVLLQPVVTEIRPADSQISLTAIGQTAQLRAAALFATGDTARTTTIEWASQNTSIVTVSPAGVVTARGEGSTQIVARVGSVTALIQVTVEIAVATVTVTPASVSLAVGESAQLVAVARDAVGNVLNRTAAWSSGNSAVATVNATGFVQAVASGQTTITATVDGRTGTAAVNVTFDPVETVTVQPAFASIAVGGQTQFQAVLRTASGQIVSRPVQWSSSDAAIAAVDANGRVTGVSAGAATIRATSEGVVGQADVTVTQSLPVLPDLRVVNLTVTPGSPTTSQTFTVQGSISNSGLSASGSFDWRIVIAGNTVASGQSSLGVGASTQVSTPAIGPYAPGSYTASLEVDYNDTVTESDETNNAAQTQFTVSALPVVDLVANAVTVTPVSPTTSQTFTVQASISNAGNTASGSFDWRIVIAGNTVASGQTNVAAGATAQVSSPAIGPFAAGNYVATLEVDYNAAITESDETNNTSQVPFTVTPAPSVDLIANLLTVTPTAPTDAETFTVQGSITNAGNSVSGAFDWRIVIGGNTVASGQTSLAAGATTQITSPVLGPYAVGSYTATLEVDFNAAVTEADETNNTSQVQFDVATAAAITVAIQSITQSGTGFPVNLSDVSGQIDVTVQISVPAGKSITNFEMTLGGTIECTQTFSGGSGSGPLDANLICSIGTSGYDTGTGVVEYQNGVQPLVASVTDGQSNTISTSPLNLTLNNPSFMLAAVSATNGPVDGTFCGGFWPCGADWVSGDVSISFLTVVYESDPNDAIAAITVTLTPSGNGVGGQAVSTDVTPPFDVTFQQAPSPSASSLASVEEQFAIDVSTLTVGGQAGPSCVNPDPTFNPINSCGVFFPAPLLVDNLAPFVLALDVIRPGQWFSTQGFTCSPSPCVSVVDFGVGLNSLQTLAGPPGMLSPISSMADLPPSSTNTEYVLSVSAVDELGNSITRYAGPDPNAPLPTDVGAQTFGIDQGLPAIGIPAGPPDGSINSGSTQYIVAYDDGTNESGFGPNPVRTTLEQRTPSGSTCFTPDNSGPGPTIACGSPVLDDGIIEIGSVPGPDEGYWIITAYVEDLAGNQSAVVSTSTLFDVTAPAVGAVTGPGGPIAGGGSANFSLPATDNVSLGSGRVGIAYSGIVLGAPPIALGGYNPNSLIGSATLNATVNGFIHSLETTSGGVPTTVNFFANGAEFIVSDVADNHGGTNTAISTSSPFTPSILRSWNNSNPAHGIFDHGPPSELTVCNNGNGTGCAPGRPQSTGLSATATGPSGIASNPFTVTFYYQDSFGWWQPIGSASVIISDNGITRTFTYNFTWAPTGLPPGSYDILAIGVAGTGDAVLADTQSIIIEGT